jgi:hypothetical protein
VGEKAGRVRDISKIVEDVEEQLPAFARDVIRTHLDTAETYNRTFLDHPDQLDQHQMQWHQWGILTHTRVFLRLYESTVPDRLKSWGLWEQTRAWLARTVDDVERWYLLKIATLLHDIGKFGSRTVGSGGFHFAGHEKLSGEIIRNELHLERFGLSPDQVAYVALAAQDHFVLALARKNARQLGRFTLDFPRSKEFREFARNTQASHPEDYVEIGVLFLGDSMAKADPHEGPEKAVAQNPINEAVARAYLEIVLKDSPV